MCTWFQTDSKPTEPQIGDTPSKLEELRIESSRTARRKGLIPQPSNKMHLGPVTPLQLVASRKPSLLCFQGASEHRFISLGSANSNPSSFPPNRALQRHQAHLPAGANCSVLGLCSSDKTAASHLLISGLCGPLPRTSPGVSSSPHTCL